MNAGQTNIAMLVAAAVVYGGVFSVNKAAAEVGWPPLAFAFLQSLVAAVVLTAIVLARGGRMSLSARHALCYVVVGTLVIGFPVSLLTRIAPHLPAATTTLAVVLSPALTLVLAMALRIEGFRWRSLFGIVAGLIGVGLLVHPRSALAQGGSVGWFLLALLVPVSFALSNVAAALLRPPATTSLVMAAGVLCGSTTVMIVVLLVSGQALWPPAPFVDAAVPLAFASAINMVFFYLFLEIIRRAGPTFFAQFNYLVVGAGVAWAAILFGERPDLMFWLALAVMLVGVYISVGPAHRSKPTGGTAS